MQDILQSLEGKIVRIDQFSDVSRTGALINIQSDYASIWSDDQQMTHYPIAHIKSVSTDVTEGVQSVPLPELVFPNSLFELLQTLLYHKVKIEMGEGARIGVLSDVTNDNVTLVVDTKQLSFYAVSQIKNISPIYVLKTNENGGSSGTDSTRGSSNQTGGSGGGGNNGGNSGGSSDQSSGSSADANNGGNNGGSSGTSSSNSRRNSEGTSVSSHENDYTSSSREVTAMDASTDNQPIIFKKKLATAMLDALNSQFGSRYSSQRKSGNRRNQNYGHSVNMMVGDAKRKNRTNRQSKSS